MGAKQPISNVYGAPTVGSDRLSILYGIVSGRYGERDPLRPPSLVQSLDRQAFLALLNDHDPPKTSILLPPGHRISPRAPEILRGWVDEWLETGRDKNGVDDPRRRNLEKVENVQKAAWDFSQRGKLSLLPTSDGLGLWLKAEPDEQATSPLKRLGWMPEDFARERLVFFLLSDLRHKLAKCRTAECGVYFVLKQWNRTYKRGTFCDTCKRSRSLQSAVRATSAQRETAESNLYSLTAKRFSRRILRDPQWYRDSKLKADIADYLNAQINRTDSLRAVFFSGTRNGVTGKWLARSKNWKGVLNALKGKRNAKG